MGDLGVVVADFLELLDKLLAVLGGAGNLTVVVGIVDDVLHAHDFLLIHALHAVQVFHAQVDHGVGSPAGACTPAF